MLRIAVTQASDETVFSVIFNALSKAGGYSLRCRKKPDDERASTSDLFVMTEKAAAGYRREAINCRIALIPGDVVRIDWSALNASCVVTYGMSSKNSVTFSSLSRPVISVQRELMTLSDFLIEQQEIPVNSMPQISDSQNLAALTALLIIGGAEAVQSVRQ